MIICCNNTKSAIGVYLNYALALVGQGRSPQKCPRSRGPRGGTAHRKTTSFPRSRGRSVFLTLPPRTILVYSPVGSSLPPISPRPSLSARYSLSWCTSLPLCIFPLSPSATSPRESSGGERPVLTSSRYRQSGQGKQRSNEPARNLCRVYVEHPPRLSPSG